MKRFILILFWLSNLCYVLSQNITSPFTGFETSIKLKFDSVKMLSNDSLKLGMMEQIQNEISVALKAPASYTYPFDSLKTIGKVNSPDNEFRLFSWNVFINNDAFKNYAIIQLKPEKDKECKVIVLHDNAEIDKVGNFSVNARGWYGAVYYKIIPVKIGGKLYYTLLGLDSFSPFVSKKLIDVLYFDNGEAFLGAPIFNVGGKKAGRMIFSYSARVAMMLNYDQAINTIVFDHLSPSESRYTGQYEYYGPDFSFDGFVFTKDGWQFVEDVKPNRPNRKK